MAAATLTAADAAARAALPDALERYRPTLQYAAKEQYFAQPVSLPAGTAAVRPGHRVYGRIARQDGDIWLQYWFFYAYNPQDRTPLRTGRHEGDWELVQLRLGPDARPDLATLSQHSWAEGCVWDELELAENGAPVLFVANGSHAMYSLPGFFGRPFPDPTDEASADGLRVRPALTRISETSPRWVAYDGRWGDTEAGWVPGESPSPRGPRFQEHDAWDSPSDYHAEHAVECGSGAPDRPWQAPLILVAVAALIGLGLYRWSQPTPFRG